MTDNRSMADRILHPSKDDWAAAFASAPACHHPSRYVETVKVTEGPAYEDAVQRSTEDLIGGVEGLLGGTEDRGPGN